ncbi:MAG: hypothetical protein K6G16_00340 [Lachnospiraceae bacterium]|nr:hypothetical protein [Lachnospiraceae bacterium]
MEPQNAAEVQSEKTMGKKPRHDKELIESCEKQREALKKQHDDLQRDLEEQQAQQKKLGEREAHGMAVRHKKFGVGRVTKEDGRYIEVTFDRLTKTFVLPGAIAGGFLIPEEEGLIEYYKRSAAIYERIQKSDLQLRSNGFALQRVEERLEKLL